MPVARDPNAGLERVAERLERAIERGRGIQLSPEDIDWFVVTGAYEALGRAVVLRAVTRSRARLEARGADLSFLAELEPQTIADVRPDVGAEQTPREKPRRR